MDFLTFQVRTAVIANYKYDRLFGRGKEYGDVVIESAVNDVKETGKFAIGSYESKNGEPVNFRLDGETLILIES
jgi:hypothetical protein